MKPSTEAMTAAASSMSDHELTSVSSRLMRLAVADAFDTYKHGTPDMKAALTKTFITAMAKALEDTDEDDAKDKMRAELQELIGMGDGKT